MAQTLNEMFQQSVRSYPESPAVGSKMGKAYTFLTYREMGAKVRTFASGLRALGIQKGDRIALISENRPEWAIADFAMLHIGAINVAIFPTLPPDQIEYIVKDSGSTALIVSTKTQLTKALTVRGDVSNLRIIAMDCPADPANGVMTFDGVMREGEAALLTDAEYERYWTSVRPEDSAAIIYTSGTTGEPKGAVLSHNNLASNVESAREVLVFRAGDMLLSFVPLNHAMGRLVDHYLPLSGGATIAYMESLRRLASNMRELKPHYMILVPRVLDMFREGVLGNMASQPPRTQKLFRWALDVGGRCARSLEGGHSAPLFLALQWWFADRLVFRKIKERMGLERLKLFFSGSAPLSHETAQFFAAIKLTVIEGYGLTETSPLVAVNSPHHIRFGTVGRPVKGVTVKIDEDGEILVRGPNVMQGYYGKPGETAKAIDREGWFHTGDVGRFDEEGCITITDRKKNLLVLANGKKVAPQLLEMRLMESPYIEQVVLVGDKRKTVGALIVPTFKALQDWVKERGMDVQPEDRSTLVRHPEVLRLIRSELERLSGDRADFEKIHRFVLLDHEFTVESGEMTPTLKVRRSVILEKHKDLIEALYGPSSSE
jgi:long-chain acyl-CoA synthetase